uniref:Non-structural protein of 4.8 kDa n=1 Tax=Bovine coronavirus TaxID=11128 RepID=A0A679DYL4_9BETC|nr:4.8 kDa protein [Bovine coronavirus]
MPMATTIEVADYTNIMPITVLITVYLGVSIGIDTSTTDFTCFLRY